MLKNLISNFSLIQKVLLSLFICILTVNKAYPATVLTLQIQQEGKTKDLKTSALTGSYSDEGRQDREGITLVQGWGQEQ